MIPTTALLLGLLVPAPASRPEPTWTDHGQVPWFEGSFAAAVAKAKADKTLVFVDFWTDWCGWCKRLDRDTFSDAAVVAEMGNLVCLSVDAGTEEGEKLARRFNVQGYPALILVDGRDEPQDYIGGYLGPRDFLREVRRVRAGTDTVADFRRRIFEDEGDLEARYQLGLKLASLGDTQEREKQIAYIRRADPRAESLPMRRIGLDEVIQKQVAAYQSAPSATFDAGPIESFLESEKYPEVAFTGWKFLSNAFSNLDRPAEARRAYRMGWPHCPEAQQVAFGSDLANAFWEGRAELSDSDRALALAAIQAAAKLAGDEPRALAALARQQFLSRDRAAALETLARCAELEPDNPEWKARLRELDEVE